MKKDVYIILGFIYITKKKYVIPYNSRSYMVKKWSIFGIPIIKYKIVNDY